MSITVTKSPYPSVPKLPGVPPVLRQAGAVEATVVLLVADAVEVLRLFQTPQWGIFDQGGSPVIIPDSVSAVEFRKEFRISDYPTEEGSFASYNKVEQPYQARVTFTKGGSDAERTAFLAQVAMAVDSLDLFSVVTPEILYINANLVRYDYARTSQNGAKLLTVQVVCEEIRVQPPGTFTGTQNQQNTQAPSGADPVNQGPVQPTAPTQAQTQSLPPAAGQTPAPASTVAPTQQTAVPTQGTSPPGTAPDTGIVGGRGDGNQVIGGDGPTTFIDVDGGRPLYQNGQWQGVR